MDSQVATQSQLNQIINAVQNKGFASQGSPDNFDFISDINVREIVCILNKDPKDLLYPEDFSDPHYQYITIDEPWGNVAAIYHTGSNYEEKAKEALNLHADQFVKNNSAMNGATRDFT